MKTKYLIKTAALALAASAAGAMMTLNSGCVAAAGVAVGGGAVAYVEGNFTAHLGNGYDQVVHATEAAIPQLKFLPIDEQRDALKTKFTARTAADKKVEITVTRESDNLAEVEIRVGTFGDKEMSMSILNRIKANL